MLDFLNKISLETIFEGLFIAIVAALILYHVFGIGKPKRDKIIRKGIVLKNSEANISRLRIRNQNASVEAKDNSKLNGNDWRIK